MRFRRGHGAVSAEHGGRVVEPGAGTAQPVNDAPPATARDSDHRLFSRRCSDIRPAGDAADTGPHAVCGDSRRTQRGQHHGRPTTAGHVPPTKLRDERHDAVHVVNADRDRVRGWAGLKTVWARRGPRPAAVLRARTQCAITAQQMADRFAPGYRNVNRFYSPCRRAAHPLAFGRCGDG
jgi:hypothetical protein